VNVLLLRHAEAEAVSASGRDFDRPLTESGRADADAVGRAIAKAGPPELILTSPVVRARETAQAVTRHCPDATLRASEALGPDPSVSAAYEEIRASSGRVLLVGHEPHMGMLLGYLTSGAADFSIPMSKGAVAAISLSGGELPGRLRWLLGPKVLRRLS
jgi:phosphohistidine phosphatase